MNHNEINSTETEIIEEVTIEQIEEEEYLEVYAGEGWTGEER